MVKKKVTICLIAIVFVLGLCVPALAGQEEVESKNVAADAYNLRMQGKVDEAKALLEQAVLKNPDNAAAYYELARINFHMTLGGFNRTSLEVGFNDAQQLIEKAVKLDPNNVIYHLFAGHVSFFQAYYSLMTGDEPGTKEKLTAACGAFEAALRLKPDYHQAMLYLVELYSQFPEEAGGDKSKAEQYAKQLEGMDDVFGAKARSMLLPEDVDRIDYWQKVLKNNEGNVDVIEELGKAYLEADKIDKAVSCFEKAIDIDPEKVSLFLDLSIYHTFRALEAMDNKELIQACAISGDAAVTKYLDSKPILPMRAYALGVRAKYKFFSGSKEEGQELLKEAKALDPYFSKATGAPRPDLFIRPDEISHNHRYLMRRF